MRISFVSWCLALLLLPSCHLFKQGRYKVINGMKFHSFTLDNKLEVLAISDKRFVKSSASLAVMAGSMQNPDEHLGLAHFLEHLLFLGTKEYPEVGDYENYLNKNGGGHNAYTSIDHTNYFFDVNHQALDGAIKRFSRFFVSPTFDSKYVERERNAVHSEHEKNLKDDYRREYRFQQVIADQSHPFAKFATGDKNTLSKANREIVMEFYNKKYSSNLMKLVIMSDQEPASLEKIARTNFSDIPNRDAKMPEFAEDVFPKIGLPKKHSVKSIRDQDILKMSFDTPDELPYWKSKPANMLAHLIGDEGEGSVLSYLKEQGWALGLSTSTWWRVFHVRITLTEEGKKHQQEIMKSVFSYINLLKKEGLKEYTYEERKILSEVELKNIEPKSSMGRASDFSSSMLYYPVDEFLKQHYLYHEYSKKDFDKFLGYLNVDNMQVSYFSKDAKGKETEDYYGIQYGSTPLSADEVKELKAVTLNPNFKYPIKNHYIPTDMSLVSSPKQHKPKTELYKEKATIYSQVDTELEIPKGSIGLSLISDYIQKDPKKYLTAQLFVMAKKQELNEWGYPARLAGLNYNLSHGHNTITVEVSGYTQNLSMLLKKLIQDDENNRKLTEVKIDQQLYKKMKEKYKKNLLNSQFDAAYQKLLYEMSQILSTGAVHRDEYINMIDGITIEDLNAFGKDFFKKVAIRAYGYGNIDEKEIKEGIDEYLAKISNETLSNKEVRVFENKFVELPAKRLGFKVKGKNNNNSELTIYKMKNWSIKDQAILDVFSKIIEQPFFTELRTQQQLGYVVAAFASNNNGFVGLGTLIQSQNFAPLEIYKRSHSFLTDMIKKQAKTLTDKDIEPIKDAIVNEIESMPNTLNERLGRFTSMASSYHGDFEYFDKLAKEVRAVTAETLKAYLTKNFTEVKEPSQLTLLYYGTDTKDGGLPEGTEAISDVKTFKKNQPHIQPYRKDD